MMRAFLLLLACAPAWAYVTPAEIRAECARQMAAGVCTTKPSAAPAPGQSMVIAGVGKIDMRAWYDYARLFNETNPQDPAMCDLALVKTATEPGSDHDLYARAVWTPIKPEPKRQTNDALKAAIVASAALAFVALIPRRKLVAANGH